MLEQLLSGSKGQLSGDLQSKAGVPQDKIDDILNIAAGVAGKEVSKEMLGGNLGSVMNLFSDKPNNDGANGLQSQISNGIVTQIVQKLGLKKETAQLAVSVILPVIMNMVTKKNNETDENDSSPLNELFGGGGATKGIGDALGGLFK